VARVTFQKYEGLGNDFILVEEVGKERLAPEAVKQLCDRHFGIGADGVLLVGPPKSADAAVTMTIFNADGSRPEMCGNGLRCVALHAAGKMGRGGADLVVDTDAGPLRCHVDRGEVDVDMGRLADLGPVDVVVDGRTHRFSRVSAGNPHAITFLPYEPREIDEVGPRVSTASVFPEGTNVEFARLVDDGSIDLVVWERGVGLTLACGTGACATVGAACLEGKRSFGEPTIVRLPGGALRVSVQRGSLATTMRGPARFVFQGEVTVP
jgi:diaminopimelate epimerase